MAPTTFGPFDRSTAETVRERQPLDDIGAMSVDRNRRNAYRVSVWG